MFTSEGSGVDPVGAHDAAIVSPRGRDGTAHGRPMGSPGSRPPVPRIIFITRCISPNCLTSRLTSGRLVPEPRAMRRRREASRMAGSLRSAGVMERMMASTVASSPRSMAAWASLAAPPKPRDHLHERAERAHLLDLLHLLEEVVEREAVALRSFSASFSASFASKVSCARSTRLTTSPMPRMRPARRSGWKTSSASVFSPVPMNLTAQAADGRDREGGAAARIAVDLGEDEPGHRSRRRGTPRRRRRPPGPTMASTTRSVSTGWTAVADGADLGHEGVVDLEPAGGVEDDDVATASGAPGRQRSLAMSHDRRARRARCRPGCRGARPSVTSWSTAAGR